MSEPEPESELGEETPKETHIPNSQSNSPIPQLDPNSPIPITKGPKGFTITCHICGQIFTKETRQKAFNSLNTHCIRKKDGEHGHQLDPIDYGLPPPTSPQTKGKKPKRVAKREYVEVDSVETELSPAEKNHLSKLKRDRILAEEETKALQAEDEREQMLNRVEGYSDTPWDRGRGRHGRRRYDEYQPKVDLVDEEIQKTLKQLRQVSIINKLKRGEEDDDDGEEESTADRLLEQLEEKDKALLDERQRSHEKEMASQRQMFELQLKNVDERIARMEKDQTKSWEQLAAQTISKGINKIGDTSSKLLGILMEEDARPPVRERGGPSNIAEMVEEVAPHLVVEPFELTPRSRGVQNIEVPDVGVQVEPRRFSGSVVGSDVGEKVKVKKK